jgi:signal transduction histidine kinase
VDRVTRTVHSLRGLARTDVPRRSDTFLPDLIENCLEILRSRMKKSNISVEVVHDADPHVACVGTQINQVLLNLILNAVQAIEAKATGGRIRISTRRTGAEMVIEVCDDGCGISEEDLPRLFDPFFTTKGVGEGTGLGLTISHNIIQAHGGQIEIDSRIGKGSTFRVCLPLTQSGR